MVDHLHVNLYRIIAICIYETNSLISVKMNRTATEWRVRILSALSDPTRLEIIQFLGEEELCVCEIVPAFGRAQSTISKHLSILNEAGILDRRIDGKRTLYRVKSPRLFALLREVDALALEEISELKKAEEVLIGSAR
jgi:ArsR family transcriptional regulator